MQRKKTRWGSCSPETGGIRLNTKLVKKPPECLEYLVVHEMPACSNRPTTIIS